MTSQLLPEEMEEWKQECLAESEYLDLHDEFLLWFGGLPENEQRDFTYVFGEN